ncbi:MAG: enoyl-CoA hydratase/isomerase family protein [Rhodospirillaceae bacterium]|nr:enoyl-CoA hydratase/isomerase family protein [Rhodospirillaceae bacterium]
MAEIPAGVTVTREAGAAWLRLNRPAKHNAFDEAMIVALADALDGTAQDAAVRAVVLAAAGRSFSAGADLGWMRRTAAASREENLADARRFAAMLAAFDRLPKPTVALVQGAAYGGALGLIAACDVAFAADTASFALSEVKLGLVPAVISPYVLRAIGPRAARRYFLTGERFDAATALRLGLVHAVVPAAELEARGRALIEAIAANAPQAMARAKALVRQVAGRAIDDALVEETARLIAEVRGGAEACEGIAAFLDRRAPRWPA